MQSETIFYYPFAPHTHMWTPMLPRVRQAHNLGIGKCGGFTTGLGIRWMHSRPPHGVSPFGKAHYGPATSKALYAS